MPDKQIAFDYAEPVNTAETPSPTRRTRTKKMKTVPRGGVINLEMRQLSLFPRRNRLGVSLSELLAELRSIEDEA